MLDGVINTQEELYFKNDTTYISIPNAMWEYSNRMLYQSYLLLENQLSQIDSAHEPGMYKDIERITQAFFNSWVSLGYREGGGFVDGSFQ
jgi:hypothetical protein